jgi:hypothetical protein
MHRCRTPGYPSTGGVRPGVAASGTFAALRMMHLSSLRPAPPREA